MVNHFRTLILNLPPTGDGLDFAQYVPADFIPVRLDGVEAAFQTAFFGGDNDRNRKEFIATMLFRLVLDYEKTRQIAESVDNRLSFDPRTPILARFDTSATPGLRVVPGDPLTFDDNVLEFGAEDLQVGGSVQELAEIRPNVPKISQIWQKIVNLSSFSAIFTSSGAFEADLVGLSRLFDTLKRDDHRVAVACCAYGLRITERL